MSDTRDKLPPPPIEPLPDLAWARLERAVLAELDVPETRSVKMPLSRWPLVALTSAALAGAAALAIVVATRDHGTPAPTTTVASTDRAIASPSRVVTGDAATDVSFGDAHITVAPASALVLDGTADHGVLAVLERGSAAFVVAPRRARPPFLIQAGAAQVRVVGTELSVTRIAPDDAEVAVTEGTVEVTFHGRVTRVTAGEHWTSVPVTTASTHEPRPVAPAPPPHKAKQAAGAAATPSEQDRFEAAATLEPTDPEAAYAAYRELARGKGAWAGNALYAMGRLAYDRGWTSRAYIPLKSYVHRFPHGANVADARALLLKLEGASP
jgi:hypothetical protein